MEGVVQYRLLGAHPAASGRYLTIGFAGVQTTLHALLQRIAAEHQINVDKYKLDVTRVTGDAAAAAAAFAYGGSNNSSSSNNNDSDKSARLCGDDVLHTYDRLLIHVSRRQLSDDAADAVARRAAEQSRRLREAELQLQHTSASTTMSTAAVCHDDDTTTLTASLLPAATAAVRGGDVHELSRVAALANKTLPVRPRQRAPDRRRRRRSSSSSGSSSGSNEHSDEDDETTRVCVLCDLPPYNAVRTPCCGFAVCRMCLQSAQLMVRAGRDEEVCAVCGVVRTTTRADTAKAAASTAAAASSARERKHAEELQRAHATTTTTARDATHDGSRAHGARRLREEDDKGNDDTAALPLDALTRSMQRCERQLCTHLDTMLALLDAPEPHTTAATARLSRDKRHTALHAVTCALLQQASCQQP